MPPRLWLQVSLCRARPSPSTIHDTTFNSIISSSSTYRFRVCVCVRVVLQPLTVVALGPLTNVALACRLAPDFPNRVKLVVMGGATAAQGNQGPASEFNFVCDPEAASICLLKFPTVTLLPWELMVKHTLKWERVDAWTSRDNPRSKFLFHMLEKLAVRER